MIRDSKLPRRVWRMTMRTRNIKMFIHDNTEGRNFK